MPELDPATLAERVLRMSRSPPFDRMPLEEVTLLAAAGREQAVPTRTVLAHAGERAMAHYVPLAGQLRIVSDLPELASTAAHSGVGALSLFGGVVLPADLVAEAGSVLLVLDRDALMGVLEEHGHVARTFLRMIANKLLEVRRTRSGAPRRSRPPPTAGLDLVSRMMAVRDALGLGNDGMGTIARLARVVRPRQLEVGARVFGSDTPADVVIPIEGTIVLRAADGSERKVLPGEVLGLVEAVAGVPFPFEGTALTPVTALVLSQHELAEDLEDEDTLSFGLIRSFSAQLWEAITGPASALAQGSTAAQIPGG